MVRIITGTLLEVGIGELSPEDVKRILSSKDRAEAGETAPAKGLTLLWVRYDKAEENYGKCSKAMK